MEGQVGGEVQRTGGKLGKTLGGALKVGAVVAGGAAVGLLGAALTKGFSRLNAIDQAKAKLAGLGNSTKTVDKIMANALSSVKGTAFGLDEAATTAASAVAAGIKPGAQLEGVLKTVADTATIAGKSMADTGAIFGSVAARGKLQGDDLMQLQSAGVPVLAMLAKHYGITAQEASKMVSSGKVDFENFNAAMQENLGGAALKSGETFTGAFANLKASLGRIGANLLSGIFPQVKAGIGTLTKILSGLEPMATRIGTVIGQGLAKVGPIISSALSAVSPFIDRMRTAFASLSSGGSGSGLVAALKNVGSFVMGTLLPALKSLGEYLLANVVPVFVRLGQIIVTNVVPIIVTLAQFLYGTLYPAVVAIVTSIGSKLKPVFDQLVATFQARVLPLLALLLEKFREWQPTIQAVISVVVAIVGKVLEFAAVILGKVLPVVIRFAGYLLTGVVVAVVAVIGVVVQIIGRIIAFGSAVVGAVKKVAEFVSAVKTKFGEALTFIGTIPGKVKGALSGAGTWLVSTGKNIVQGLIDGIKSLAGDVVSALLDLLPGPLRKFAGKLGIHSPSTVFEAFGENTVKGFVLGVKSGQGSVDSVMGDMSSRVALPALSVPGVPALRAGSLDSASAADRASAVSLVRLHPDDLQALIQGITRGTAGVMVGQGGRLQGMAGNRPWS